ncbi:unnamed protein product [Urochloa humidicola]
MLCLGFPGLLARARARARRLAPLLAGLLPSAACADHVRLAGKGCRQKQPLTGEEVAWGRRPTPPGGGCCSSPLSPIVPLVAPLQGLPQVEWKGEEILWGWL